MLPGRMSQQLEHVWSVFEQESQHRFTFTMIHTPCSYGRARGVSFNMTMRMELEA
jgi:hypothetical protein